MSKVTVVLSVNDLKTALAKAEKAERHAVVFELTEPITVKPMGTKEVETVYRQPLLLEERL